MKSKIAEDLEILGLNSVVSESIADDILNKDARSLLHEMLISGLWKLVIDETKPELLAKIGGATVRRLLDSGHDVEDLVDVVRETQVDMLYNMAQLIDWPTEHVSISEQLETEINVRFTKMGGASLPIYGLHGDVMTRDPSGRSGEPRSLDVRRLQKFSDDKRDQLLRLVQAGKLSEAALLWKKQWGGNLKDCLKSVQSLKGFLK
ncbi:hypothetical protein [Chitinilyticum litopenaei]|uniref:hypothetical protein n=1 Tax=Chitinilyticum litopenaei TaxID=1121276 RepID=UPI0011870A9F|nr:hypothetical protein [Chitinilyticum litopenaei]